MVEYERDLGIHSRHEGIGRTITSSALRDDLSMFSILRTCLIVMNGSDGTNRQGADSMHFRVRQLKRPGFAAAWKYVSIQPCLCFDYNCLSNKLRAYM